MPTNTNDPISLASDQGGVRDVSNSFWRAFASSDEQAYRDALTTIREITGGGGRSRGIIGHLYFSGISSE
jgi:hypothetical protein